MIAVLGVFAGAVLILAACGLAFLLMVYGYRAYFKRCVRKMKDDGTVTALLSTGSYEGPELPSSLIERLNK